LPARSYDGSGLTSWVPAPGGGVWPGSASGCRSCSTGRGGQRLSMLRRQLVGSSQRCGVEQQSVGEQGFEARHNGVRVSDFHSSDRAPTTCLRTGSARFRSGSHAPLQSSARISSDRARASCAGRSPCCEAQPPAGWSQAPAPAPALQPGSSRAEPDPAERIRWHRRRATGCGQRSSRFKAMSSSGVEAGRSGPSSSFGARRLSIKHGMARKAFAASTS